MRERGYEPEIMPANIDETLPFDMAPSVAVMFLALKKAEHIADQLLHAKAAGLAAEPETPAGSEPETLAGCEPESFAAEQETIIIAADTVVVYDGEIIGKPADEEDAWQILTRLRGQGHDVLTGVCVLKIEEGDSGQEDEEVRGKITHKECLCERTEVFFKDYSDEELLAYIRTDEPYDKAGGYAIQETFGQYIDRIEGDYDNVVGFPMYRVEKFLCRKQ